MNALAHATLLLLLVVPSFAVGQDTKYSLKSDKAAPPKELKDKIAALLKDEVLQVSDPAGALLAEFWFRKEVPADATPEQAKNGLTYRELKETNIVGAVRLAQGWSDYRKQRIKPGVYTLRLGFQPQDGDHAGSAPHQDFILLCAAAKDTNPAAIEQRAMFEMSLKTAETGHPAVMMLFPVSKAPALPRLETRPGNHVVLVTKEAVKSGDLKANIGFALTLVGFSDQ